MQRIKELRSYAQVVTKTANVATSCCCFAKDGTKLFQKCVRPCSTLIVPYPPNQILHLTCCHCHFYQRYQSSREFKKLRRLLQRNRHFRAVFKWLSKVITWLRLLRLVIGFKDSHQFFNQWESKPKPTAPCTRDFPALRASYRWLLGIVIGSSRCLLLLWLVGVIVLVFRQSFENRSKITLR